MTQLGPRIVENELAAGPKATTENLDSFQTCRIHPHMAYRPVLMSPLSNGDGFSGPSKWSGYACRHSVVGRAGAAKGAPCGTSTPKNRPCEWHPPRVTPMPRRRPARL